MASTATALVRYEVRLYAPAGEQDVDTFTWATSYAQAVTRVAEWVDQDLEVWAGWSFKVL